MSEKLWKVAEFAEKFRLDQQTIYCWIRVGKLRAIKIGKRIVRIPDSEFVRLAAGAMQ